MAGKFLELSEAAAKLGVTPEQLIEMRSKGEIFGVRKGSSWEFKQDEVDRVLSERSGAPESSLDDNILSFDNADFDNMIAGLSGTSNDDQESILISDIDDSPSSSRMGSGKGSTIIGQDHAISSADSDISLAPASGVGHSDALSLPSENLTGSEILGGSKTDLMGKMKNVQPSSYSDDEELKLSDELSLGDDLLLSDEDSGSGSAPQSAPLSSDDDDDLLLAPDLSLDDNESVLSDETSSKKGHSGKGSDITGGGGGDSGINLMPSDGGLSLEEEPLDLGGSQVESLELSADDGMLSLEEEADPDQATQLKADDQFMLSPSDALAEDEPDSGSQVIALEDSESFDQEAATMLRGDAQPALVADDPYAQAGMAGMGMGGIAAGGMMAGAAMSPGMAPQYAPQPVEAPYTIWQVLFLLIVTTVMTLSGMLMVDVVNNMWSWNGSGSAATFVMDGVISTFGLDK